MQTVSGDFDIDWSREDLERVRRTIVKKYNAEIHSQSAIEGLLEMMKENGFLGEEVDRIRVDIFDVAHLIIGGGAEGDKTVVRTKEEADHSLPYILAVAALDGKVMPAAVRRGADRAGTTSSRSCGGSRCAPATEYTERFPEEHACRITVTLKDGRDPSRGETRLRRVPHPADGMGACGGEVPRPLPRGLTPRPTRHHHQGGETAGTSHGVGVHLAAGVIGSKRRGRAATARPRALPRNDRRPAGQIGYHPFT